MHAAGQLSQIDLASWESSRARRLLTGLGEQRYELVELEEGPWPAVGQQQRDGVGVVAALVDEVQLRCQHP